MITTLTFQNMPVNPSIAIGDLVYYISNIDSSYQDSIFQSGDDSSTGLSSYILVGKIVGIVEDTDPPQIQTEGETTVSTFSISAESQTPVTPPQAGDYIFFLKDSCCNTTSIKGYYNSVTFKNTGGDPAELFAASCGFVESSK